MPRVFFCFIFIILHTALQAEVPPLIEKWLEKQAALDNVHSSFQQTKNGGVLKKPRITKGQLWKGSEGSFRWELGQPAKSILVFDGTQLSSYSSRKKEWKNLKLNNRRYKHLLAFIGAQPLATSQLKKDFTIQETAREETLVSYALLPTSGQVRNKLKQIDLQIDPRNHILRQLRILMADDSATLITLSAPKSADIPVSHFQKGLR